MPGYWWERMSGSQTTIADCNDYCGSVNKLLNELVDELVDGLTRSLMNGLTSSRVAPADRTARVGSPAVGNGGRTA